MFDFRYHALSLMAVFIALVVGLLLGVAIGDEKLVSSAKDDVRNSLRGDIRQANAQRDDAKDALSDEQEFVDEAYPILTGAQLRGRSIGIVLLGDDDQDTVKRIRDALEPTGAEVRLVAVVKDEVDPTALGRRAGSTRYAALGARDTKGADLLEDFGRRMGIQMVTGGRLIQTERTLLMDSQSGELGGLDGVVVLRTDRKPSGQQAADDTKALQEGIAQGIADTDVSATGVESRDTDPSQVGWYRDRGLSSVDNVDEKAGQAALVYVLAGAEGAFGRKDSRQALLPPLARAERAPVQRRRARSGSGG